MVEEEELPIRGEIVGENESKKEICGCVYVPIRWFRMLVMEMHWSFVFGVVVTYGISQGVGGALNRVGTQYYMKDVQKVQPSEAQVYAGITYIPWIVKPIWGILTDVVPILGYHRRPYFILAGKENKTLFSYYSLACGFPFYIVVFMSYLEWVILHLSSIFRLRIGIFLDIRS